MNSFEPQPTGGHVTRQLCPSIGSGDPPEVRPSEPQSPNSQLPSPPRRKKKCTEVKRGSITVRIYATRNGPYRSHTLVYYEAGQRKREVRAKLDEAVRLAEQVATRIANGETTVEQFTQADRQIHLRICQLAAPTGKPPLLAMSEYAEAHKQLAEAGRVSIPEAVKFYIENRPKGITPLPIPELVETMLADIQPKISSRWHRSLEQQLECFAGKFDAPLHALSTVDINRWLGALPIGERSRDNYRAAVNRLVTWAKANGYLARAWEEMDLVQHFDAEPAATKILTPEQITSLLSSRLAAEECGRALRSLIPFIALTGFAGVRHEEMNGEKALLDWCNINLKTRQIYVPKDVAKTGRDRIVPISDNLAAWLAPYAKRSGSICPLSNSSSALSKAKASAGLPHGRNETRNTLRKSFISYRLAILKSINDVAEEAGNSPAVIRRNYRRPVPIEEALRWFSIWPTEANVIQLSLALK